MIPMLYSRGLVVLFACASLVACERSSNPPPTPTGGGSGTVAPGSATRSAASGQEACAALGGRCVGVGDCGASVGHLADPVCGAPHLACCITPADSCGGREDFACCGGSAEFRPTCRNGHLECGSGMTRAAPGGCTAR